MEYIADTQVNKIAPNNFINLSIFMTFHSKKSIYLTSKFHLSVSNKNLSEFTACYWSMCAQRNFYSDTNYVKCLMIKWDFVRSRGCEMRASFHFSKIVSHSSESALYFTNNNDRLLFQDWNNSNWTYKVNSPSSHCLVSYDLLILSHRFSSFQIS